MESFGTAGSLSAYYFSCSYKGSSVTRMSRWAYICRDCDVWSYYCFVCCVNMFSSVSDLYNIVRNAAHIIYSLLSKSVSLSMTRNAVWCLSNLCRGKNPPPDFTKVGSCVILTFCIIILLYKRSFIIFTLKQKNVKFKWKICRQILTR